MNEGITIRPATTGDAVAISGVLALNRDDPGLFQESGTAVARTLGDFFIALKDAEIVGCGGLHQDSPELAEVYAVAVRPQYQGQGIGRQLMEACQQRASSNGTRHLWLATVKPEYFSRYGFQPISRWELPAAVLLRKLRQTLQQPSGRRLPALFGKHTFMRCEVTSV
jgi:amino-acid N-acetyltransferase